MLLQEKVFIVEKQRFLRTVAKSPHNIYICFENVHNISCMTSAQLNTRASERCLVFKRQFEDNKYRAPGHLNCKTLRDLLFADADALCWVDGFIGVRECIILGMPKMFAQI